MNNLITKRKQLLEQIKTWEFEVDLIKETVQGRLSLKKKELLIERLANLSIEMMKIK